MLFSSYDQNIWKSHKIHNENKILKETNYKISIEAGRSDSWSKFIGDSGMSFGIENFGKSAPYKEVYKYFKLSEEEITNFIQKKLRE